MADMLAAGAAWLTDRLRSSAASTVAYVRSGNTATVPATIGQSRFESQDGNGVIEQWESRDFIIKTDELPYGEPQRGDRIYEQLGGVAQIYEVAAPRGVPLFHYGDAFQTCVRVHTKRVDADLEYLVTEQGDEIVVPLQVN
jgi:hypothetical protein